MCAAALVVPPAGCGPRSSGGGSGGNGDPGPQPGALDSDGDGVNDDVDQCDNTPATVTVDDVGCPVSAPGTLDTDGDEVNDDIDQCANTPAGVDVNANGCPDSDGDTVFDDVDLCPDTPAGMEVDETGCGPEPPVDDSDEDGVPNDVDLCPNTPVGEDVDETGCPAATPVTDSDGDGVNDDVDECANTPSTVEVDEVGCPVSAPGTPDTDEDGVNDDVDQCDDTPVGEEVDANGCSAGQRDDDGDRVFDDLDQCLETPPGEEVDAEGCAASERDSDGDGVFDDVDQCADTPPRTDVDANGCPVTEPGPSPPPAGCGDGEVAGTEQCDDEGESATCDADCTFAECGDGTLNVTADEQCDDGNTTAGDGCDENCLLEGGAASNDLCANPTAVTDGTAPFSNEGATTDSIVETGACANFVDLVADIWFCYEATCSGTATVSLCGSSYDTTVSVYAGCECPSNASALACNDDGCGVSIDFRSSRTTFPATAGNSYLIRVAGYDNSDPASWDAEGTGKLTIFCGNDTGHGADACGSGSPDCFTVDESPGCADEVCCLQVCIIDPYCCDVEWDGICTEEAVGVCGAGFATCGAGAGDCFTGDDTRPPGCSLASCCQAVCEQDPVCCVSLGFWDQVCAEEAVDLCDVTDVCAEATGSCFAEHADPGCSNQECCELVCLDDPYCCDPANGWDELCVERAVAECRE